MNIIEELGNLYSPTDTSDLNLAIGNLITALDESETENIQLAVNQLESVMLDVVLEDEIRQLLENIIQQINTTIIDPPVTPPSNTHGEKPKIVTDTTDA